MVIENVWETCSVPTMMFYIYQCFPTFLSLRHLTEKKYKLRHPVANSQQFPSGFDDIFKMHLQ